MLTRYYFFSIKNKFFNIINLKEFNVMEEINLNQIKDFGEKMNFQKLKYLINDNKKNF